MENFFMQNYIMSPNCFKLSFKYEIIKKKVKYQRPAYNADKKQLCYPCEN